MEFLLPLILLVPLLLMITRSRKQQRQFQELQSQLQPGQAVVTTAGLHGTIAELEDDVVLLDVADGVRLRWARAGIGQVVKSESAPAEITAEALSGATAVYPDDSREDDVDPAGEPHGRRAV
ncbi:MAG: preprotein translocase subunit YajC [Actinomycetes bacterium]